MTSENPYRAPGAASLEASELPASKRTELFFEATLRNGRVEVQYRTAYYVSQYAVILGVVLIWTQVAGLVLTGVSLMVVPTLREHGLSEKFG